MTSDSIAGIGLALVFGVIAMISPRRAVYVLAIVGGLQLFQAFMFAGSRIQQGFFPIEVMASVAALLVLLRALGPEGPWVAPQVDKAFVGLIVLAAVSLVWNQFWLDPAINAAHVKPLVSVGQIALIVWPLATYQFVARSLDGERTARRLLTTVTVLAVPSVIVPFASEDILRAFRWSVYFGLAAAPFCFAQLFYTRSRLLRAGLFVLAVIPAVNGIFIGKTFLYAYVAVFMAAIGAIRAPRLLIGAGIIVAGLYFSIFVPISGSILPGSVQGLVTLEEKQGSWGGKSGRAQLAVDALGIWTDHPALGVGPGNSWPYMHHYSVIDTPHNQYLNVLLELGLCGLVAFLLLLAGCLRIGWRLYHSTRSVFAEQFALGWLGYFAGMTLGGLTGDFMLHSIRNGGLGLFTGFYMQWIMLGVLVGLTRLEASADEATLQERAA
jgi:O-antigen ligase